MLNKYFIKRLIAFAQIFILLHLNSPAQEYTLSVQTGHTLSINNLCYSPDGSLLLSSGNDNLLILWDVISGKQIRSFVGHTAPVRQSVFHPKSKFIASIANDKTLKIWNINNGEILKSILFNIDFVKAMSISEDGNYIAIAGDSIKIIDTENWKIETLPISINPYFDCISFNHSANAIAIGGSRTGKILVYDLSKKTVISKYHIHCKELAFSQDDRYLTAAGIYGKLRRWDLQSKAQYLTRFSISENKWIDAYYSVAISPNVDYFAGGNLNHKINLYNIKNGKIHLVIKGHDKKVITLAYSPDGNYLASSGVDRKIQIWNTTDGSNVKTMKSLSGKINCAEANSTSETIAVGTDDGICTSIEIKPDGTMNSMRIKPGFKKKLLGWQSSVKEMYYLPDDQKLIISADLFKEKNRINSYKIKHKPALVLWNTKTNEVVMSEIKCSPVISENKNIYIPDWNKNLLYKINNSKLTNTKISINTGRLKCKVSDIENTWLEKNEKYLAYTYCCDDSLNGLAIFGTFNKVIWESKFKSKIKDLKFISDTLIACALDNEKVIIFDFIHNIIRHTYSGMTPLLFHGNILSYISRDNSIQFVDISGKHLTAIYTTHTNEINVLKYLNKGSVILSGSSDGSLKFYDTEKHIELASMIPIGTSDRMYVTPDHYYYATRGALKAVGFVDNTKIYSFEQFDLKYNRPDIVFYKLGLLDSTQTGYYFNAYLKRLSKMGITLNDVNQSVIDIPDLEILSNDIPLTSKTDTLSLEIKASDYYSGLDRLNASINGVPVFGKNGLNIAGEKSNSMAITVKLALSNGKNKIQLSVRNRSGIESMSKNLEINYKSLIKPNLYLVTIGASSYLDSHFDLKYAAKDANDVLFALSQMKKDYQTVFVKNLTDTAVTLVNVRRLKEFLKDAGVNDAVIIFLAGHGMLDQSLNYYFASYDNDFNNPSLRAIPYSEIEDLVDMIKPRKKLVFLDACHSGEFDKDEVTIASNIETTDGTVHFRDAGVGIMKKGAVGSQTIFELSKMLFADIKSNSGAIIISSAGGAEYAMEGEKWQNGIFTYYLLKGIRERKADLNSDGIIWASELQQYIYKEVTEKTGGKQKPATRVENLANDFRIW